MNGKQAQSAVLNKVLTYDYFRLTRENTATSEFDASANYDRILPALVVIACQRLGLGEKVADLLYDSLINLKHQVRTNYGLSHEYGPTTDQPLFGTGQGSGGSPTFWVTIADALFNAIDSYGPGLILRSPNGNKTSARNEDGFVDDTALGVDVRDDDLLKRLTTNAQRHERMLYSSGGKLALNKCTWLLINWAWEDGKATLHTYKEDDKGFCTDSAREKLELTQSESDEKVVIPRLNPSKGYRTLGIWIAADGNQK